MRICLVIYADYKFKLPTKSNMTESQLIIIGSSNTDMVVRTSRFPKPGETILGQYFFTNQGGKGANQAVAAARLGGNVLFISSVGDDIFGETALQSLRNEGINVGFTRIDKENPSGVAMITVDNSGENSIVVAPGANSALLPEKIHHVEDLITENSIILMQLEIPIETVEYIAARSSSKRAKIILNPAPAQSLSQVLMGQIYLLTPNEEEASLLSGITVKDELSARKAAKILVEKGVHNIIITLGSRGALALYEGTYTYVEAKTVKAIDTTAAGDVFNGALAVALNEGKNIQDALIFANQASALAVTRLGAQSSIPYRYEIEELSQTL